MIKANAPSLSFSNTEAVRQANWFPKTMLEICNTFMNVRRLKLNTSQVRRLQQDIGKFEIRFKDAMLRVAKQALADLKRATPKDTGKTRAGWSLNVVQEGDILRYELNNTNRELIDMLNYGTRAHIIEASKAKVLHFKMGKKDVFATFVHHPGTVGLGFIEKIQKDMATKIRLVSSVKV